MANLELRVISPVGRTWAPGGTCVIDDIRRFRAKVYDEFSFLPPISDATIDEADEVSWHVVAMREDEMVGCIRLAVFDPHDADEMPTRALANSRYQFSRPDEARCLAALKEYADQWLNKGGPLVQAGGLVVAAMLASP